MKTYVVDASIVLGYLLEEGEGVAKEFESLLTEASRISKIRLLSSCLLSLEVGNGLRFSLKDEGLAEKAYRAFLKLPIEFVDLSQAQLKKTLGLSYSNETTFYDSSYHALAIGRRATFLTCDRKYFKKARDEGWIRLLK